jgi:gamma-glutamyltranspeptidase/glutathione hydrolase
VCFLLVLTAREGRTRLLDFFVSVPELTASLGDLVGVVVDYGDSQQTFYTGPMSVAVPGAALGVWEAHRRWGSLPWAELLAPAIRLARDGVVLNEIQAFLHRILDPLLRYSPEGDALYGPGRMLLEGERFAMPELADTLERVAAEGAGCLYRGELAERIAAHVPLTLDDLARYEVVEREPLAVPYRGDELHTNPPPASGGRLLAAGLEALGDAEPTPAAVIRAMEAQDALRAEALGGTTHISAVDGNGDAASLSCSMGSSGGIVVPGTGLQLNNMLGETHLVGSLQPGERLMSMMAPSFLLRDGAPRLVVGSAGSSRLAGAILQVVVNVGARELGVEEAVEAARLHFENGVAHCEDPAAADDLEAAGYPVVRWRARNLFFGGVSAVEIRDDGSLAGAGDPRRGGAAVVVET